MDHRDDGKTRGRRRLVVPIGNGGDGSRGAPPHRGIYQEATYDHIGEGGLLLRLCPVYRGGEDARDEPSDAMVGSRRGK